MLILLALLILLTLPNEPCRESRLRRAPPDVRRQSPFDRLPAIRPDQSSRHWCWCRGPLVGHARLDDLHRVQRERQ
jgi:hypothetical protein